MYFGAQHYYLVCVISNQLEINDRVENAGHKPRISRHRRLQGDKVQTLVVNKSMLMIGLGLKLTGSR